MSELCVSQMWASLIAKAKEGGIDVIQTYVFWNLHEPKKGQVRNFTNFIHIQYFKLGSSNFQIPQSLSLLLNNSIFN